MEIELTKRYEVECVNCDFRARGFDDKGAAIAAATDHLTDWRSGATWHELLLTEKEVIKRKEEEDEE